MDDKKVDIVGRYAASLSVIEVALGSLLHAFQVPFAGTVLSLNQGYLLCRSTLAARDLESPALIPYSVSNVAAVLKSLAPAGKKLGPMLSLSMQGLLFSFGPWTLGPGLSGLTLGMTLLSLWAFIQPVLTYYLYFGRELFEAIAYLFKQTLPYHGLESRTLWWMFGALILAKVVAAIALAVLAYLNQGKASFQDRLVALAESKGAKPLPKKAGSPFALAVRDLTQPIFILSLATTGIFLFYTEGKGGRTLWLLLRPIAVGFIFFYFSRTLTLEKWLLRIEEGRFRGFALACKAALSRLKT
jgi:hypothetical protein